MSAFEKFTGINVASGFKLQAQVPLDGRSVVDTIEDRDALITENGAYEGMRVYVKATQTMYTLKGTTAEDWEAEGGDVAADLGELTERVSTAETNITNLDGELDNKVDKETGKGLSSNDFTDDEKSKLDGIEEGANNYQLPVAGAEIGGVKSGGDISVDSAGNVTVNDNSHNHTIENVTGLQDALDGKISASQKGTNNGVAELDATGKVPSSQLPSYVDDVIEGYLNSSDNKFYEENSYATEITGEGGKIYIDIETNKTYRWSGSVYAPIADNLALGETESTAYRGDRGKIAYDHSQTAHAPSNAEENVIVGVQVNSSDVAPDSNRKINITVPTKTSDLANDSGYITETTTYDLGANQNAANGNAKITLAGSDASNDEVKISGTGAATVTTDGEGNIIVNSTDTTYTEATGSSAGLLAAEDKVKIDNMPTITVSASAPTTAAPNSLWFEVVE